MKNFEKNSKKVLTKGKGYAIINKLFASNEANGTTKKLKIKEKSS